MIQFWGENYGAPSVGNKAGHKQNVRLYRQLLSLAAIERHSIDPQEQTGAVVLLVRTAGLYSYNRASNSQNSEEKDPRHALILV